MALTGKEIEEVIEALVDGFDRKSLERMLRVRLDRRLDQITSEADLDSIALDLITAAEREGWTPDLIREAAAWNPGNERLAALAGLLLPRLETSAQEPGRRPQAPAIPRIDPDNPPFAALRALLLAAFDARSLARFCQIHEPFRPVLAGFGPGQGLEDMVDRLLDQARIFLLWDDLLRGVAEENPYQFDRFVRQL